MARHDSHVPESVRDASMTLLTEVQRRPLDPGYAEAARRRALAGSPPHARRTVVWLVLVGLLLGLGVTTATLSLRQPQAGAVAARRLLEQQVRQHRADAESLAAQNADLSAQIAGLQNQALRSDDPALLAQLQRWAVAAAQVPVSGPGLRVVLTDAPSDGTTKDNPDLRVQDVDLQVLVNGLWAAGAEAIAVNGQRLTATTAIRTAGSAVLVDLVPLVNPYTVEAVGSAADLQTSLARSSAGQHLATLRATYNIGVTMTSQRHLQLPGAGTSTLQSATAPSMATSAAPLPSATATVTVAPSATATPSSSPRPRASGAVGAPPSGSVRAAAGPVVTQSTVVAPGVGGEGR